MTSPTLSEKVKEILDKLTPYYGSEGITRTQAHQAIMEAIRESVPLSSGMTSTDWINGFQQCREEMLRRLQ